MGFNDKWQLWLRLNGKRILYCSRATKREILKAQAFCSLYAETEIVKIGGTK